jgi:hypothetical protein
MGVRFGLYIEIQTGYAVCFLFYGPCNMLLTARKIRNNKPQITHLQRVFLFPEK